jgi:riboflavin kinase
MMTVSVVWVFQEPWLLHEFSEDFYGEELRLVVVGYIRPEVTTQKLA